MKFYPVKTPKLIQRTFRGFIWNVPADKKEIYLTFDDGPIPDITPWVLNTLSDYQAKATFFCIGKNVKAHPDVYQSILDQGHAIGNHTFNHLNGWNTSLESYIPNVEKANKILQSSVKNHGAESQSRLFRPPYGKMRPKQAKSIIKKGYKIIMWDVLSGDFDPKLSKESCLKNVVKNSGKGSIIVFHDSLKAFKNLEYTLPKTLEYFSNKGFGFNKL